jgi:hypothetical protein
MPTRIKLKNSAVQDKIPLPADLEIGEVAVGAHVNSPKLFFKDSADNIISIGPGSAVESVNGKVGVVVLNATDVSALAAGDDVSTLNNDAGYITSADIPAVPVSSVNGLTGTVVLAASNVGAATASQGTKADSALQAGDDVSELNNDAGYITSADVPASAVLSVNGQTGTVSLSINDLTDVETASSGHVPTDGQYLVWHSSMNHWMPGTLPDNSLNIPALPLLP